MSYYRMSDFMEGEPALKFKFWPDKQPAPEEGHGADSQATDEMIVNELFMETSFEEPWQFMPEAAQAREPEAEQLHLPVPLPEPVSEPENVVRLSDVRRQKEEAEEAPAPDMPAGEMMTFTPEGEGNMGFADEDSYAETLSRYRREVILDGAKFTSQSINSLVEGYFNNDKD